LRKLLSTTHLWSTVEGKRLTIRSTVQKNILGPEGQKMQKQVWEEVLSILEQKVPEVRQIVNSGAV